MRIVILDGALSHEKIADALRFPPYYGRNLDALYDCLTAVGEKTVLYLSGADTESPFFAVIKDAARENKNIVLVTRGY